MTIDMAALDDGLSRAAALVNVPAPVLGALRQFVVEGGDAELRRINPIAFARARGLDEGDVVNGFVAGAKAGVFQFTWALTCPMCGSYAHEADALGRLAGNFYCAMCDKESASALDSLVEVCFAAAATVRALPPLVELKLEGKDWLRVFQNPAAHLDPKVTAVVDRHLMWVGLLRTGETHTVDVALPARATRVAAITQGKRVTLRAPDGHRGAVVDVDNAAVSLVSYAKDKGVVVNNRGHDAVCVVSVDVDGPVDFPVMPDAIAFDAMLTGRDLLCNQAFRDLFSAETLSAGIALHIEKQAVLFTDLKGSTQLYDSIGDVRAFSLVSEHFKILLASVQAHGGAVVKTIGDAVMATFVDPADGVRSALDMAATLRRFNADSGLPPLSLKIGLHVGACIVVSSNGRPDYFGQTVNIAARVQALAEGDELVLTDAARGAKGVEALLAEHKLTGVVDEAALKGVADKVRVHTFAL